MFRTNRYSLPIMIKSPEPEGVTDGQNSEEFRFVRDDWNGLCDLMDSWEFPENGYRDKIDLRSVIDFLIVNEVTKNEELGQLDWMSNRRTVRSMLAYKDVGGKITLGPVWDFDCGFGYDYQSTHRYFMGTTGRISKIDFLQKFYQDTIFTAMMKNRWNEHHERIRNVSGFVDNLRGKIAAAVDMDTKRWYRDNNGDPNSGYVSNEYNTNHAQVVEDIKRWWNDRVNWLNGDMNSLPGTYVSIAHDRKSMKANNAAAPKVSIRGKTLNVSSSNNSNMQIRLIDVRGKTRANFKSSGNGNYSLTKIPAGRYFVEIRSSGVKQTVPVMVK